MEVCLQRLVVIEDDGDALLVLRDVIGAVPRVDIIGCHELEVA